MGNCIPCGSKGGTIQAPRRITASATTTRQVSRAPRRPERRPYTALNGSPRKTAATQEV